MLTQLRLNLFGLSKTSKTIILNIIIITLIISALLFIYLSTKSQQVGKTTQDQYAQYLQKFQEEYGRWQSEYRKFSFYQTQDELIFSEKQLDDKYKKGLNEQYNISQEQFQAFYTIVTAIARKKGYQEIAQFEDDYYYDWEQFMPPIKDMRDYDGSHIFAAVALMEFQVNRKQVIEARQNNRQIDLKKNWITLSEQEIIDCCQNCTIKKRPQYVYNHTLHYGISRDSYYPYVSSVFNSTPGNCKTIGEEEPFKIIKGWYKRSGCNSLRQRLEHGPAVTWVDARTWRQYSGGILQTCGTERNHYALVVGRGIGYWKVRNSWGQLWGQHGHIRLKYGNTCGICSHHSFLDIF